MPPVNAFISALNPFVDEKCSFCSLRDIVPMFPGLQQAKVSVWAPAPSFWEVFFFSQQNFILGFQVQAEKHSQKRFAELHSGKGKVGCFHKTKHMHSFDCHVKAILIKMLQTHLNIDYQYHHMMNDKN